MRAIRDILYLVFWLIVAPALLTLLFVVIAVLTVWASCLVF